MDITYRPFDKNNDYEQQRKLFGLSFPETIGTPVIEDDHYSWKYEKFPHKISSYQYIGSEPQEMVGYYAALPYPYQINGKEFQCGMVCDVMTHPNRRGKGIFTKIGHFSTDQMKNAGLAFTTGYPIRPEVIPGHIKVGWKIVLEMPMYLRLVGLKTLLPKPIRFLSALSNPLIRCLQLFTFIPVSGHETQTLSREDFFQLPSSDYQSFLNAWLSEQKNALIKSHDFLAWRTNAPHSLYKFLVLKKEEKMVGLCIARPTILKGVEAIAILDFMVLRDDYPASRALHQELWKMARHFKKDVIVCMCSNQWAKRYGFFKSLYVKTPAVFSLIVKKLSETVDDESLFLKDKWHLFWIDSDDV